MREVNIIIDIDNTLADTQGAFFSYINKASGKTISPKLVRSELRGDSAEWYEPYAKEFIVSTDYQNTVLTVKPYPNSIKAMELLSTLGNVHIVSSRINNWHHATHEWLKEYGFMDKASGVYLRDVNEMSVNFKKRVMSQLQADYLFDDSTDIVLELKNLVKRAYLIQQPWNEDLVLDPEGKIKRHVDMLEAVQSLSETLKTRA